MPADRMRPGFDSEPPAAPDLQEEQTVKCVHRMQVWVQQAANTGLSLTFFSTWRAAAELFCLQP